MNPPLQRTVLGSGPDREADHLSSDAEDQVDAPRREVGAGVMKPMSHTPPSRDLGAHSPSHRSPRPTQAAPAASADAWLSAADIDALDRLFLGCAPARAPSIGASMHPSAAMALPCSSGSPDAALASTRPTPSMRPGSLHRPSNVFFGAEPSTSRQEGQGARGASWLGRSLFGEATVPSRKAQATTHLRELRAQAMMALRAGDERLATILLDGIERTADAQKISLRSVLFDGGAQDPFVALLNGQPASEPFIYNITTKLRVCGRDDWRSKSPYISVLRSLLRMDGAVLARRLCENDGSDVPTDEQAIVRRLRMPRRLGQFDAAVWLGGQDGDLTEHLPKADALMETAHRRGLAPWRDELAAACPAAYQRFILELGRQLMLAHHANDKTRRRWLLAELEALPASRPLWSWPSEWQPLADVLGGLGADCSLIRSTRICKFRAEPLTANLPMALLRALGFSQTQDDAGIVDGLYKFQMRP
jgi:hypothetical protein